MHRVAFRTNTLGAARRGAEGRGRPRCCMDGGGAFRTNPPTAIWWGAEGRGWRGPPAGRGVGGDGAFRTNPDGGVPRRGGVVRSGDRHGDRASAEESENRTFVAGRWEGNTWPANAHEYGAWRSRKPEHCKNYGENATVNGGLRPGAVVPATGHTGHCNSRLIGCNHIHGPWQAVTACRRC